MRLLLPALIAIALLAGCGEDDEVAAPAPTPTPTTAPSSSGLADLTLTIDGDGSGAQPPKEVEVRCEEAQDSALCTDVAGLAPADFGPTPRMTACTQQYGGPETAHVTGTLRGEPVDARFSREQGCEIARWDAVVAVLDRNPIP
jgi:hypothetical protein